MCFKVHHVREVYPDLRKYSDSRDHLSQFRILKPQPIEYHFMVQCLCNHGYTGSTELYYLPPLSEPATRLSTYCWTRRRKANDDCSCWAGDQELSSLHSGRVRWWWNGLWLFGWCEYMLLFSTFFWILCNAFMLIQWTCNAGQTGCWNRWFFRLPFGLWTGRILSSTEKNNVVRTQKGGSSSAM